MLVRLLEAEAGLVGVGDGDVVAADGAALDEAMTASVAETSLVIGDCVPTLVGLLEKYTEGTTGVAETIGDKVRLATATV